MNGVVGCAYIGKGQEGEMMRLQVAPDRLDVIEFGGVFWQPFYGEPVDASCKRRLRGPAEMNGAVIAHEDNRLGLI